MLKKQYYHKPNFIAMRDRTAFFSFFGKEAVFLIAKRDRPLQRLFFQLFYDILKFVSLKASQGVE